MLHHLCTETHSDIILIQEHWLTPDKLNQIFGFSDNYIEFGISAMEDKVASGIFYGRPHGGVAVLVNNKYSKLIHNVICKERYVIIMIESVAFVNVYFPCKSGIDIRGRNYTDIVYTMIDLDLWMHIVCGRRQGDLVLGQFSKFIKRRNFPTKLPPSIAKNEAADSITNDLHDALIQKDNIQFWKLWNSRFGLD